MFAREVTPGLTSLVKKFEAASAAHADSKYRAMITANGLKDLAKRWAATEPDKPFLVHAGVPLLPF